MIFTEVDASFYRLNTPKYSSTPTSGAGAALRGGRLNRPGVEALYLSQDVGTATAEFQQQSALLAPAMLVSYRVKAQRVVDFQAGFTAVWDPLWQDFNCDWRKMVYNLKVEPPTWVLSDMVMAAGGQGVLFPSAARSGGVNLVLYHSMLTGADQLEANDPRGDLPKDDSSWR